MFFDNFFGILKMEVRFMYVLTKCKIQIDGIKSKSYGFALKGCDTVRYDDLSPNKKRVKSFIKLLNREKAEICHLDFLVEEFLEK
jgi:hypothetical protein